ncbi:MAG: ATP synthase F1 subunit delta [Firmicutes bacterium]|nr:ATP synthase F1 subunit delta [Bacillota bacterium]
MLISTIARRYAEALYEAAKDAGLPREIGEQLEQLLRVLKTDRELDLAFRSPALTAHRRRQLLEECFQGELHPFVLNLCQLLWTKGRENSLPSVVTAYRQQLRRDAGLLTAEVISAANLTEEQLAPLRQALEKRFGQPVVIEMKVDRSLLGGVRVRVGNTVLDGSVRGHLQAMRERMLSDLPQRPDEAAGASEKAEI